MTGSAWQGGLCCRGGMCGRGACMAGGMYGGHVSQGVCVAGETATAADSTYPTEMLSCFTIAFIICTISFQSH